MPSQSQTSTSTHLHRHRHRHQFPFVPSCRRCVIMSSKDNLALDLEHGVRRWDRARWISVFSSHNPTIREVTECLGLGLSASSSTTNRGIPKFDNPDYRKLSSEVTKLSKELPKERDALLDFAADPRSLDTELEELLGTYGPAIWSKDADRTCLLTPDSAKKTYTKDLFYEQPEHKEILKIHLHRWIIIKACYYIRNMKLKRPSGANDYDTLADIDGESQLSPHGTPHSLTPPGHDATPGADLEVKPINGRKRKSEAFGSLSDGEERSGTPHKRPYSTMPLNRRSKSPRKSLHSLLPGANGSMENVPPLPTHKSHLSPSPANGAEPARIQLSPLSNNELNGTARQPSAPPSIGAGGFQAVNGGGGGGFTAVNMKKETSRDGSRPPSRGPQHASPLMRDARTYTSPYDSAAINAIAGRQYPESSSAPTSAGPPVTAPTSQAPQAATPSTDTHGNGHRGSPASKPAHQAPVAPQPQHQAYPHPAPAAPNYAHEQHPPNTYAHFAQQAQARAQQLAQARGPSRTSSPVAHHGRSLAPSTPSRSITPHAPAAAHKPPPTSNAAIAPAPAVQTAHAYGMTLVPTQPAPAPAPAPASAPRSTHPPHSQPPSQPAPQPAPSTHQPRHPTVLKSQPVEAPQVVARPAAVSMVELRALQCEVTAMLLHWLFPKPSAPPDEPGLLHRINTLWYHGESIFRPELGSHYDLTTHILTAWLQERYAISSLQHALATQPGLPTSSAAIIDRLLAMNDLRAMRLKWKNMSPVDGMSPEDILIRAFGVMTMTEHTEFLFKEGLNRVERSVFEFLRTEDAKIVLHRQ
ncbi:hypothetical protein HBH56_044340 [Parastagonospora nodorum]|uniref:Uncharacterized protein n=1 Tax=Phaeosphaeria nodorum (strain SN15 / ATCC MYA-4574 / FGSC 10173) TaxID=321614 RepID=A0A7U2HYI4_PHANO|nr:hypothetical protein HBH56_044340 [Parastagonospora nodorum]QRC92772.1 hypothetical protein JI435_081710 [Parastagonospora nodorum SN15]KAH3932847.1 hypothetical protein HBH54_072090 [Parastagonospora nodorum]KAH3946393.1 hypothetical protein HBH53_131280 [Parastagonospora nodorum]KAH4004307.1 hypothetical protein HBI10_051100 [Parastagonospora nodorum]